MKGEHFSVEGMGQAFVEFRHLEYNILLTRFERIRMEGYHSEESKYLYFIYIFRKEHKYDKKKNKVNTFNIICFHNVYHTFAEMMKNIDAILAEYIIEEEELLKCIKLATKLNPEYIEGLINKE